MIIVKRIIERNKLIAKFMGAKEYYLNIDLLIYPAAEEPPTKSRNATTTYSIKELLYHSSWNWLMPVIEKISCLPVGEPFLDEMQKEMQDTYYPRTFGMLSRESGKPMFRFNTMGLHEADTLFQAAWLAVVDFIEFYNKNKV